MKKGIAGRNRTLGNVRSWWIEEERATKRLTLEISSEHEDRLRHR
jgi:hypothetical protein